MDNGNWMQLIDKMAEGYVPPVDQLAGLLAQREDQVVQHLFASADRVKQKYFGNFVDIRAIIEFSNYCRCSCLYCGLRAENRTLHRYRMTPEEIVERAKQVWDAGYHTVILQSGEDLAYTKDTLAQIIRQIKGYCPIQITLSVGERSLEEYACWKEAGADRYLIKHETADETLYNSLHPHSTFERRLECQRQLKELGYTLGSGFMVGLPGQTEETLAKDILLLREMKVDMAGIGPYISHDETPLKGSPHGSSFLTLRVLAAARLVNQRVWLPSTTALNLKGGLQNALHCGASVIMQKATPQKYAKYYDIYPGREHQDIDLARQLKQIKEYLQSMAMTGR